MEIGKIEKALNDFAKQSKGRSKGNKTRTRKPIQEQVKKLKEKEIIITRHGGKWFRWWEVLRFSRLLWAKKENTRRIKKR